MSAEVQAENLRSEACHMSQQREDSPFTIIFYTHTLPARDDAGTDAPPGLVTVAGSREDMERKSERARKKMRVRVFWRVFGKHLHSLSIHRLRLIDHASALLA